MSRGMEAVDAINPGRESFYDENPHYRELKHVLFGSEETISGLVGRAIREILDRSLVRGHATEKLREALSRRKALGDISSAVSFYGRGDGEPSAGLRQFFKNPMQADGLATAKTVSMRPPAKLGGFDVSGHLSLDCDYRIDYRTRTIRFDFSKDTWSNVVYLNGRYYDVLFKQGKPDQALCEFDNKRCAVYVNWAHPVKLQMDDAVFIKSAILLRLAYHAVPRSRRNDEPSSQHAGLSHGLRRGTPRQGSGEILQAAFAREEPRTDVESACRRKEIPLVEMDQPSDLLRLSSWLKSKHDGIDVKLFDFMLPDETGAVRKHKVKDTWTGSLNDEQAVAFRRRHTNRWSASSPIGSTRGGTRI